MINQYSQLYLCSQILHFETQSSDFCKRSVHVLLLRIARGMTDKQFVYADCSVFSTSKVALFMKHKYAQDDVKWLN